MVPRILLTLILGLGVGGYFFYQAKTLKDENQQLASDIATMEKDWVKLRRDQGEAAFIKQNLGQIEKELKAVTSKNTASRKRVDALQATVQGLEQEVGKLFIQHRKKVWSNARGTAYEKITTRGGQVYEKVIISGVRDGEVSFMFGTGAGGRSLSLDQVPEIWIEAFLYTPEEVAAAYAAAEQRQREAEEAKKRAREK